MVYCVRWFDPRSRWSVAVTQTRFVGYRDRGFWAYDVALGVLLKHVVDVAESRSAEPRLAWLEEAARSWWITAVLYGLEMDVSWSPEHVKVFTDLVRQACERSEARAKIPAEEIAAWPIVDDLRIFPRGAVEVFTAPVVELGRAIIAIVDGSLPEPPAGTWWLFGCPEGRTTIQKRV